jgi:hypothetical protein
MRPTHHHGLPACTHPNHDGLLLLAVGYRQPLVCAARAETRFSLRRHLLVVGGNLLGGPAILALGDAEDALQLTLIGTAIGEA